MSEQAIKVSGVSKVYKLYNQPMDRLKETFSMSKKAYHCKHYALKNIDFSINKGDILGIVGTNGSGKSTLLKIITGVLQPSTGEVSVVGNIEALLELGAGFNAEYTGLENIFLHGTMKGKSKEEVEASIPGILEFADIGDFIHQPVKTYSSGMFVRLAFAVATNIKPDILVVDEALSVGDINFQMKSINRIKQLIKEGTTVLFVSHDIVSVKTLCNKAVYLNKGQMVAFGDSGEICDLYLEDQNKKTYSKSTSLQEEIIIEEALDDQDHRFREEADKVREGTGKAKVINLIVENEQGVQSQQFIYKEKVRIKVYFEVEQDIDSAVLALYVRNRNQLELIGTNTKYEQRKFEELKRGQQYLVEFEFINYLQEGEYGISTILVDEVPTQEFFDRINNVVILKSYDLQDQKRWALVGIPIKVKSQRIR